jgi:hypothetical protein
MIIHTHTSILSFFTANKFAVGTSSTVLSQVASVPFGEFLVNASGMELLQIIYCDLERAPFSPGSRTYRSYQQLFELD